MATTKDDILVALGSTVFIFTQDTDIYVIADVERTAEFLLDGLSDIVILPGKIR